MTHKHYFALVAIVLIVLVGYAMRNSGDNQVAVATTATSSASDTPEPTEAPTATPDRHAQRQEYQQYWNKNVGALAMAFVCINYAAKTEASGDSVGASQLLQKGKDFADQAKSDLAGDAPEKFNNDNISLQLFGAADKLSDAIAKESDYLDSQKPSDGAAAIDEAGEARDRVDAATSAAQSAYVDMGGKASDLETMQQKVKETVAAMDTLLQASNNSGSNDQ